MKLKAVRVMSVDRGSGTVERIYRADIVHKGTKQTVEARDMSGFCANIDRAELMIKGCDKKYIERVMA